MPHVIVLLPGILGSVLKKDGKTIWGYSASSLAGTLLSGGAKMHEALALPEDPVEVDDLGDGIIADALMPDLHLLPGFWKIDGYSTIIKALEARFDITQQENFFVFPYDWRRDNRVAARQLARQSPDWLQQWRDKSGNPDAQLIIMAHSMGGLVSRHFLEVLEGWKNTKALITFGTPYRGSLNALDVLANGLRKGPRNFLDMTALIQQLTSVYQLLPIYKAYDPGDGTLVRVGEVSGIPNVNADRAAQALKFHQEIQAAVTTNQQVDQYRRQGYSIHPIVGLAQTTQQSARFKTDGVDLSTQIQGQELTGDGTVPRVSAIPIELSNNSSAMFAATQHGSLQNAEAVLAHLEGILSGFELDLGDFKKGYTVSVDVEDLFFSGEVVRLKANSAKEDTELIATLWQSGEEKPMAIQSMASLAKGNHETTFETLPPGSYRVQVTGREIETASDAFAVADITESQLG